MNSRDERILKKIVTYCEQLKGTCDMFGNSEQAFAESYVFRNACCMCVIQIGELAGKLSEETRTGIPNIPWTAIRGMRNVFAHDYGSMDIGRTWRTIQDDIPDLRMACEGFMNRSNRPGE